jgi:quercetin dioxygenase-like cupin family protein
MPPLEILIISIYNVCIQVPDRSTVVKKMGESGIRLSERMSKMEKQDLEFLTRQGNDARSVMLGSNKVTFLLSAEETGGVFSLTEFEAAPPPAPSAPLHIHWDANETIYILEGEFRIMFEDRSTAVHSGASIFVPRGTRHTIANAGTKRGRLLVVLTPPGFEGYWKEMSQLMEKSGGPVDPGIALATQKKYHVDMLGQARNFEEGSGKSLQS